MTAARRTIAPDTLPEPFGVWSPAVLTPAGQLLFVSGLTARQADGTVPDGIEAQTRAVCDHLEAVLAAAGGTPADIATVTVYVTDVTDFDAIHKVRRAYWPQDPPASAMVQITRLVDSRCLIEISAIAVLNSGESS